MKSVMIVPGLLSLLVLAGVFSATPLAFSDESGTDTEQRLKQKNVGSGESTDFNCAENMITSASDGIECIPSGPTPPTPPPSAIPFTIVGSVSGTLTCGSGFIVSADINAEREEDGTVTGSINVNNPGFPGGTVQLSVNGGTTDGDTFSLSGPNGICQNAFTVSGDCGTGVTVSYEETDGLGTWSGDVECTLA